MCRLFLKNKKGFTLVELMVVVLILGLLTAIGIPSYRGAKIYAERRIVETNLRMIEAAVDLYFETGNTEGLNVANPWSKLVPDYLHAPISGPGTAYYYMTHWVNENGNPLPKVISTKKVGGYVLKAESDRTIHRLPW